MIMDYTVGIDTGGTFCDIVVMGPEGRTVSYKIPTTYLCCDGLIQGVDGAAGLLGLTVEKLLGGTGRIIYSTTIATNTIVQRANEERVGCLVTSGFRDTLFLRRGVRKSIWDCQEPYPAPFVRRAHTVEINERVDARGQVVTPLNVEEVREKIRKLLGQRSSRGSMEAVAICFLHSYANPHHERLVARIVKEEFPQVFVSASVDVAPEIREYERMSTTVFNAYVGKTVSSHLAQVDDQLRSRGYASPVHIMQSNGGVSGLEEAALRPVNTIFSGPAGGVMAARYMGALLGLRDILAMDMGGTSFDVGLIRDGEPLTCTISEVASYPLMGERIDIRSIGAGGGTIAWVDAQGVLRVGPHSAGSVPGPACFGRGGEEPTVTDADVLLGFINPHYFLGGRMELDVDRAREAIGTKIAGPLGVDEIRAADGIVRVVEANMIDAVRLLTVQKGIDPRDVVLMAYGGAGPTHAASIMREIGATRLIIPANAATFSSFGLLTTNLRHTYSRTFRALLDQMDLDQANDLLAEMEERARATLIREGITEEKIIIRASADMSFMGQLHELNVPLPETRLREEHLPALKRAYADIYRARYGFSEDLPLQVVTFRVEGVGLVPHPVLSRRDIVEVDGVALRNDLRQVYFSEAGGFVETPVYRGEKIPAGCTIEGPAVVEYPDTTLVIRPGQRCQWDEFLNAIITPV
ncbi:N-methylhydantoinase A [Desulfofundulus luciae]|uniref:N-methylhydantoinase A n=2 Tax=Desulfofundulus luciae TaxID=74702 RepID=A0ABU0B796_9FIRM|nr:N-methylhydantoinase A [Desulfofundulus luciae]